MVRALAPVTTALDLAAIALVVLGSYLLAWPVGVIVTGLALGLLSVLVDRASERGKPPE